MYVCMYVCTYVCTYVRTYVGRHVCTYVRLYVRTYVGRYVCMYVWYMHIDIGRYSLGVSQFSAPLCTWESAGRSERSREFHQIAGRAGRSPREM